MQFHPIHGHNIILEDDAQRAKRVNSFCQGITFSALPIHLGQKISIIINSIKNWRGALRIGITTHDPVNIAELPSYAIPDLTSRPGFWAKALNEQWASNGNKITFYVNKEGLLQLFVNNEYKGAHLSGLPFSQSLWVLIDIYGTTNSVRIVDEDYDVLQEIIAQGPKAMQAYQQASSSCTLPLYRTRLMVLGLAGTGKTSLKKALLGQRYHTNEISTEGIDTSVCCEINLSEPTVWQTQHDTQVVPYHKSKTSNWGRSISLEEEYAQAFAANIAQELLIMKKKKKSSGDLVRDSNRCEGSDEDTKDLWYFTEELDVGGESLDHPSVWSKMVLQDLPDPVAKLVHDILREAETKQDIDLWETEKIINNVTLTLSIWDFAGNPAHYTTHQVFLSSRAVYILVFNMCLSLHDSANAFSIPDNMHNIENDFTNLDYLQFWLNMIHANITQEVNKNENSGPLSPRIFIVGTHREDLHIDPEIRMQMVEEQFFTLRESFKGKAFIRHIVTPFFAVDSSLDEIDDEQLICLKKKIIDVVNNEPYMGEQFPLCWLKFEETLHTLVDQNIFYITLDQAREIARDEGIESNSELQMMLQFYHDLGVVIYYGGVGAIDSGLQNTVILKPQWLMEVFRRIITAKDTYDQWPTYVEAWARLDRDGILEDHLIDRIWRENLDQKMVLIGLMEKFDLLCERIPIKQMNSFESEARKKSYYVPSRLNRCPDFKTLYSPKKNDVVFYLDFNGFISDGLFHRLMTRAVRWSQECGGREPRLYCRVARFFLDFEHDFILQMSALQYARVKVVILRVADLNHYEDEEIEVTKDLPPPDPMICAKVRNFLDSTLNDLREMWMKQISYKTYVKCPCDKVCNLHQCKYCSNESCLHFLLLDECLSNKIVCCEYQRIKTAIIQKWFPSVPPIITYAGPIIPDNIMVKTEHNETILVIKEKVESDHHLPSWVKRGAKLLNIGAPGTDWMALGAKLGYLDSMMDKFGEDLNPGLALITDWIFSSGNTALSISTLISYLEQVSRDDVVDIILKSQEEDAMPPQIFISYQWDIQEEALMIRDILERAGYLCWMDIGQMGGGDLLNSKIYQGINNSKVMLSCITPKYTVSHSCNKEVNLADLLQKPIIPIMIRPTVWPPPGAMALTFSQLLYINLRGNGGHGGTGQQSTFEDRLNEILHQVSCHCAPDIAVIESFARKKMELSKKTTRKSMMSEIPQTLHVESLVQDDSTSANEMVYHTSSSDNTQLAEPRHVAQANVTKCTVCTIL